MEFETESENSGIGRDTLKLVSDRATKKRRPRGRAAAGLPDRRKGTSLVGQRFGKLTVLGEMGRNKWGHLQIACECDCGNQSITTRGKLTSTDPKQRTTSCGCVKSKNFVNHHDKLAGKLSTERSNEIFRLRLYGYKAAAIASRHKLSKATVDGVIRVVGRKVMNTKWMPVIKAGVASNRNYFEIAARTGLAPSTIAYIAKQIRKSQVAKPVPVEETQHEELRRAA